MNLNKKILLTIGKALPYTFPTKCYRNQHPLFFPVHIFHVVEQFLRRRRKFLDQRQSLDAIDRANIEAEPISLLQVLCVRLHRHESILQRLGAVRRQTRRRSYGARQLIGQFCKTNQRPGTVILGEFPCGWRVWKQLVPLGSPKLQQNAHRPVGLEPIGLG